MEPEEDMFLVIVGDETTDGSLDQVSAPMPEQTNLDETDGIIAVDDLLEAAQRHGEYLDVQVKLEPGEFEFGYHEKESKPRIIKTENNCGGQDYVAEDDEEYIPEVENEYDTDYDMEGKTDTHRYTMLKPWQRRSFVSELRQQYAELSEDKELLINTLSEIMRNVKVPPLPKDYYVMDFNVISCVECGATTESVPAAGRHYQEKHGQRYLVCYACGVDFRSTTNLYKHEKRCVAPDAQVVLKARAACLGRKGRGRPYLSLRVHNKPKKHKYPCKECSAVFHNKVTLQSHEYLHRGERPFQCHVCPSAYTSHSALSRHTKTHTDIQFICDHCKRSFKVKQALVTHMDTHRPLRKHECGECGRRFAQRAGMLVHVNRDHRRLPPPCACQICPRRYPRMSLLKAHMKRAHGMLLMTRKMFFKSLPTLTETQVKQAKVVLKSEAPSIQDIIENQNAQNYNNESQLPYIEEETNYDVYHTSESAQSDKRDNFSEYVDNIQQTTEKDIQMQSLFNLKNAGVIHLEGSVLGECKIKLLKDIESMVEVIQDSVEPETRLRTGELKILSMPDL